MLPPWFERAIKALQAGDIDGYATIYAPDAIHEFPFAAEGEVRQLVGRDAIIAYMRQLPALMGFGPLSDVRVREADDEIIIEAIGHHRRISDSKHFGLSYVWFITLRDCQVIHFRDYMNPLQLSALGE
jgi:ketosteroid isomerase-like protein